MSANSEMHQKPDTVKLPAHIPSWPMQ